jgi:hypothetical protein
MAPLNPDSLRRLAADTLPVLHFSTSEAFYPIRAESWLTHTSCAPWDQADPDDIGALPADHRHRGTCLLRSGPDAGDHARVAGPPNPSDQPLRLEASNAVDAIGNPAYAKAPDPADELFLSFAGWTDPKRAIEGDLDYLWAAFSELTSAVNQNIAWEPLATAPNRPFFGHPQPASPSVYCEVDWAGAHFREAPPVKGLTSSFLDQYLQVTYYYLFAARTPLDKQKVPTLEGQWAAISLFYPAGGTEKVDEDFRPPGIEPRLGSKPEWVVFSRDPEHFTSHVFQFGKGETTVSNAHVSAWVGAGTHRFFPTGFAEVPVAPGEPWPVLDYEPGSDSEIIFPAAYPGLASAVLSALLPLASLGWIGFLIWLIAWIISLIVHAWDDTPDQPYSGDTPPTEPNVIGDAKAGSPAPPDPAQVADDGWATNEGSPQGWDIAYFDLRVISRIKAASKGAPELDPPPWWSYTGRWGVKVVPESMTWTSGSRRTDERGRSWAYWMAAELYNKKVLDAPVPKAP